MSLKQIETGLIPVYESEKTNAKAVSARELYKGLDLSSGQFSRWSSINIIENDFFKENVDFYRVRLDVEGNEVDDFILKLDMAKHLVMLARTEKAHLFRDYFIKVEEKYKQSSIDTSKLSPELQMFKQIFDSVAAQQLNMQKLTATLETIKETIITQPDNWREEINRSLNKISQTIGLNQYQDVRRESYKLLEQRAGVNLERRLDNLKVRLMNQGKSKTAIDKANKLDCIEEDKKLMEIYGKIINEYSIKYVA